MMHYSLAGLTISLNGRMPLSLGPSTKGAIQEEDSTFCISRLIVATTLMLIFSSPRKSTSLTESIDL